MNFLASKLKLYDMIILEEQLLRFFLDCKLKTTSYCRLSDKCRGKQTDFSVLNVNVFVTQ